MLGYSRMQFPKKRGSEPVAGHPRRSSRSTWQAVNPRYGSATMSDVACPVMLPKTRRLVLRWKRCWKRWSPDRCGESSNTVITLFGTQLCVDIRCGNFFRADQDARRWGSS